MKRRQSAFEAWIEKYKLRTSRRYRLAIYLVMIIFIYALLIGSVIPQTYDLVVGQISRVMITAPTSVVNSYATQKARQAAAQNVAPRYDVNPSVLKTALRQMGILFNEVNILRNETAKQRKADLFLLHAATPSNLSFAIAQSLLYLSKKQFDAVQNNVAQITQNLLQGPFSQNDLSKASLLVDQKLVGLDVDRPTRMMIGQIVLSVLHSNLVYDATLTDQARSAAMRSVPDVWINRGDVIIRRGQLVTPEIMGMMTDLKLLKNQPDYGVYIGFFLYVAILVLATAFFIQSRKIRLAKDNVRLLLFAGMISLMVILLWVTKVSIDLGLPFAVAYAVPLAMGSMMVSLFFGTSLSVLTSVFLALLGSATFGFDFSYFFIELASILGASLAMKKVDHRRVFMRAGSLAALCNVVGIIIMQLVVNTTFVGWSALFSDFAYGIVGGLLSAVLTMGLLPYLETTFGVITHMGLLELANPNHPLLRQLLMEAPGTYHHSLIVGNLAEAAAEVIGADPLICRVGALFHDVGKMTRPMFFIENQMVGENPHDKIAPTLSHLILTSHVTDGLEMLKTYNLPAPVRDICASHHGTTVLWYFYQKAVKESGEESVTVEQFRYPGPKPHSKESAIVMICDAVEASVRSLGKPTPQRIEAMIRKIIHDRVSDGQLEHCEITFQDLNKMVDAFMMTLKGIYHERIEYPDPAKIAVSKEG